MNMQRLISPIDLLKKLPLSRSALYRLLRSGRLPCVRVCGRYVIDEAEVERWLECNRVVAAPPADPEAGMNDSPGQR